MRGDAHVQAVIGVIVRRLVTEYAPEKIVLFGSHAYGEPHGESDIDLLIVKDTPDRYIDRQVDVLRLATGLHQHVALEPIVMTPAEVAQRLRIGDHFVEEMLLKGEVLYAA
ncbi:MAG: nucleotidyltransferase domain-containing protein [Chloroflexota bacterium]